MNNSKKKIILTAIIISIITIIILAICLFIIKKDDQVEYLEEGILDETSTIIKNQAMQDMSTQISIEDYYTVKNCLNMYYTDVKNMNGNVYNISQEDVAKELMPKLNDDFIKKYNLTEKKLINLYKDYKFTNFLIENLYVNEYENSVFVYLLYGKQINELGTESEDYGFIVKIDWPNNTYSIAPYEYMKDSGLSDYKSVDKREIKIDNSSIETDEENRNCFARKYIDNKQLVSKIYDEYRLYCQYDEQYAYKLLKDEYKNKHFTSEEYGKKFLNVYEQNILGNYLEKMIEEKMDENYTQFICKNNIGNYFIITIENHTMNYDIMLDNYTLQTNYFTKKYNSAKNKEKAEINLDKFKQMINLKDYESAYNVLNKSFKEKYFKTDQDFEKYIKENLFKNNSFEYETITNSEENCYKIKTIIKDNSDTNKENIVKRFKVELLENKEFAISFDI